jgi:hypothetical protein
MSGANQVGCADLVKALAEWGFSSRAFESAICAGVVPYERHLRMSVWHDAARVDARAQGIAVQVGRDRDYRDRRRHDSDVTVSVGPGGVTVGPRRHCRTVTTRIERDDGRMITRREPHCDYD